MRAMVLLPAVLAALVLSLPAFAAPSPDPCAVLTTLDASTVLGANPPRPTPKTVGFYRTCTYTVKKKTMTVQTRHVPTQASFDKGAKATKGIVFPMSGVGAPAYSINGTTVLLWQKGTEVTITFVGISPVVSTQQALAKSAVSHL